MNTKLTNNPKKKYGQRKPPIWYIPFTAMFKVGLAHLHGHLKYGHFNWRKEPIEASTYLNACFRHIAQWVEGEEEASDSGIHHLAHAIACLNIVIDAQHNNSLIDDRHPSTCDIEKLFKDLSPKIEALYDNFEKLEK